MASSFLMSSSTSSSSTTFAFGITAALIGQLLLTIGFYIWDNHWTGSAFALNSFKCNLASIGFLILTLISIYTTNDRSLKNHIATTYTVSKLGYLLLFSTIGILIGDVIWLQALQLLGAKRVILMDSLKPFLAAFFGWWLLDEDLQPAAFGGVAITLIGVVIVSLEHSPSEDDSTLPLATVDNDIPSDPIIKSNDDNVCNGCTATFVCNEIQHVDEETDNQTSSNRHQRMQDENCELTINIPTEHCWNNSKLVKGTIMSIVNIVFDTYGAVLIKQHGVGMTVWEINLIRFGFPGLVMALMSIIMLSREYWLRNRSQRLMEHFTREIVLVEETPAIEVPNDLNSSRSDHQTPWFSLPLGDDRMTRSSWVRVCVGTIFVTFLTPMLSNYALFQVALALALTLGSTGPLYSLLLSYLMPKTGQPRTIPSKRCVVGTLTAVTGIIILAFYGMVPKESNRR
jgi:drug/metabolite transporter (DMT)-like permease